MQTPHTEAVTSAGPERPWLTMVHGTTQNSRLFSAQVDAFRDDYRILLVDLPGHGGSTEMAGPYGQVEYTRAVAAALDARKIDRTHFWGTHTGAAIALLLTHEQPQRIAALVLDGAVLPGSDMPSVTAAIARARETARARGLDAARKEWFEQSAWFDVIRAHPETCRAREHWEMIVAFGGKPWTDEKKPAAPTPLLEQLGKMQQPTLILNGEHDVPDFLSLAEVLVARMPNAERAVIAGAGGFPLWEFPAATNARVREFLARFA